MSSIMDELKTLQGSRVAGKRPAGRGGEPGPEGAARPPHPVWSRQRSQTGVVLGLAAVLVVLLAVLVVRVGGGPPRTADRSTVVAAADRPEEKAADVGAEVVADAAAAATETEAGARQDRASVLAELIGRMMFRADGRAAPEASDPPETVPTEEPERALTDKAGAEPLPEVAPEPPEINEAETAEATSSEPVETASAEPVEVACTEPVEVAPPKPPVRILTQEEDEANKAAIRGLKVLGVLADDRGVGVYTSSGELRAGGRFHGMQITEVTLRSVLFESGNKHYRRLLPR